MTLFPYTTLFRSCGKKENHLGNLSGLFFSHLVRISRKLPMVTITSPRFYLLKGASELWSKRDPICRRRRFCVRDVVRKVYWSGSKAGAKLACERKTFKGGPKASKGFQNELDRKAGVGEGGDRIRDQRSGLVLSCNPFNEHETRGLDWGPPRQ